MIQPPRGLRLNNPGNIRHSADRWQGAAPEQPDPDFVRFTSLEFGVRAVARLMLRYEKLGFNTARKIIGRYAPAVENDAESYVRHVADALNVEPEDVIVVDAYEVMAPLVGTICRHETGKALPPGALRRGLAMAGVHGAPAPGLVSKGVISKGVAGGAAVLTLAGNAAEPIKKVSEGLQPFQGSPVIAQITVGLLTVAGVAAIAGIAADWLKARKGL